MHVPPTSAARAQGFANNNSKGAWAPVPATSRGVNASVPFPERRHTHCELDARSLQQPSMPCSEEETPKKQVFPRCQGDRGAHSADGSPERACIKSVSHPWLETGVRSDASSMCAPDRSPVATADLSVVTLLQNFREDACIV